ncbi:hypothetical protein WA026_008813 [Henosepilachna vigintioctopunctata]|uniref:HTH psq-type domain-containing protein n=1 Tax=Henosepilachna vigintioctopunctata TaxID=420089 RepID=A0AAW1V413_9CUCU
MQKDMVKYFTTPVHKVASRLKTQEKVRYPRPRAKRKIIGRNEFERLFAIYKPLTWSTRPETFRKTNEKAKCEGDYGAHFFASKLKKIMSKQHKKVSCRHCLAAEVITRNEEKGLVANMPRNRKRLTERGQTSADVMMQAVNAIGPNNSIRSVAKDYNINYRTPARYYKKYNKENVPLSVGYVKVRQVFNDDEENNLSKYLQITAGIYFGLSPLEVRKLWMC